MRPIVTCECCRHRMAVERNVFFPETFKILCHNCEAPLRVEVSAEDIRKAAQRSSGPPAWLRELFSGKSF